MEGFFTFLTCQVIVTVAKETNNEEHVKMAEFIKDLSEKREKAKEEKNFVESNQHRMDLNRSALQYARTHADIQNRIQRLRIDTVKYFGDMEANAFFTGIDSIKVDKVIGVLPRTVSVSGIELFLIPA